MKEMCYVLYYVSQGGCDNYDRGSALHGVSLHIKRNEGHNDTIHYRSNADHMER